MTGSEVWAVTSELEPLKGSGQDTFILGSSEGTFYTDLDELSAGLPDRGIMTDFNIAKDRFS